MRISFFLRSSNQQGKSPIRGRYSHQNKRYQFPTGYMCKKSDWSIKRQRLKNGKPFASEINTGLDRIENQILGFALELKAKGLEPVADQIRMMYEGKKDLDIWQAWENFSKSYLSSLAKNTQKSYKTIKLDFEKYQVHTKKELIFRDFDKDFAFRFSEYLKVRGNNGTTIHRKLKYVKTFLDYCLRQGWHQNEAFKDWKLPKRNVTAQDIALTRNEVMILQNAVLSEEMTRVRDLFIFQCHTGLRYSDTQEIQKGQVFNGVLHFDVVKAKKRGSVALSPKAQEIYEIGIPILSNQYYNRALKELCKSLEGSFLDDCNHRGKLKQRWQAVSSHTARRTFITIMLETVPINVVKMAVGHSSIGITEGYDKTTEEVKYRAVREVWG